MQRSNAASVARAYGRLGTLTRRSTTESTVEAPPVGLDNVRSALLGAGSVDGGLPEEFKRTVGFKGDLEALRAMALGSWINLLLVCVPLAFVSEYAHWSPTATFVLSFFALVPLALILGDITEDLALRFGQTIGGLINATFGNVVELILSMAALQQGLYQVVATSLIGSILSNLLLVLGCCFLFGGMYYKTQEFNAVANQATSSLLFMSCIGIIIPTMAGQMTPAGGFTMFGETLTQPAFILSLSRYTSIILLAIYIAYLVFQLKTHAEMFAGEEEEEEPAMTMTGAFVALAAITVTVAFCSEFLTGSIESFSEETGMSKAFVGMIILPIAGNACEHITAIIVAMKNKMDLALGVAVGSSIQIAIFAIPFVVLYAWATGHPFGLDFDMFAVLSLTLSVIHANFVTSDARSHWLMGVQLVATYILIALTFLYR